MSSQFDHKTGSAKAVDGLKDRTYAGGQCAISAYGHNTAWWWVDLGDLSSIHHITMYPRTENFPWGKHKRIHLKILKVKSNCACLYCCS